ncbi:methyltransferase domain-containing protein [Litorilinea aerophila]|uniref:Methyltransferase domain-containing protein n=1 Tax=Litorilinea aerophila TaxID=1204385 RepID=A0A540VHX4_9CHLR|nr:class I SAM-dependent methyltransferase [Litorilinea aerophila]MCC9076011.1 methyltransferase domain-containing protein [Litorilinea aerophila]
MANKKLLRWVGAFLLLDGVPLFTSGRAYVRLWQIPPAPKAYRRTMAWLAAWPNWLLRAAGMAEIGLGLAVLARAPVEVPTLYRAVASRYDAAAPLWRDWLYPDAHLALDRALATHLPPGGRVLDLGCGTGANLERLLALGLPFGAYSGVDRSPDMLAQARAKFGHLAHVEFQQLDLLVDPWPEGPFDLIVSTWAFEHLPEPEAVVAKAWTRLRPGGHMILLTEIAGDAWRIRLLAWIGHFFSARLLNEEEYRRFPGLIAAEHFNGPLAPLALLILHKPEHPL